MDEIKNQMYPIEEFLELVKHKQDRKEFYDPEYTMQSILQKTGLNLK